MILSLHDLYLIHFLHLIQFIQLVQPELLVVSGLLRCGKKRAWLDTNIGAPGAGGFFRRSSEPRIQRGQTICKIRGRVGRLY